MAAGEALPADDFASVALSPSAGSSSRGGRMSSDAAQQQLLSAARVSSALSGCGVRARSASGSSARRPACLRRSLARSRPGGRPAWRCRATSRRLGPRVPLAPAPCVRSWGLGRLQEMLRSASASAARRAARMAVPRDIEASASTRAACAHSARSRPICAGVWGDSYSYSWWMDVCVHAGRWRRGSGGTSARTTGASGSQDVRRPAAGC